MCGLRNFHTCVDFDNLSPRKFSKDATQASINEESTQVYFLSLIFWKSCTISILHFRRLTIYLHKFSYLRGLRQSISTSGLRNFHTCVDFDNLSPRVDLEIFTLAWTSTKFSKDATQASINEESTQVYFLSLIFSKSCTVFFVSDFDSALSKTDDLPPCVDLEIFILAWILKIYFHEWT
ncbi:hypothetical protein V1477_009492 [Vespula maculifrons]|uniref:Uncharacterized protein n=1 Tax=Vespula maculifrons TaxID=7453 RepID=A0ABD2C9X6_VESMC